MVTILHTNDLHNCVGMVPRLATLVARERERDPGALLLDGGDVALSGRDADLGVQLLASLGYDAMVTGNSENDVLEHRANLSRVGAPAVVANIAPGALGFPTVPCIIREARGVRLAILGLTALSSYPRRHRLHRPDAHQEVQVHDAVEAARRWVPELRDRADLAVVVSHVGLRDELRLALRVPGIDLIIGGHSHHRLSSLLRIGNTHIAHAGAGGAYLGVLTIKARCGVLQLSGHLEPVWQDLAEDGQMMQSILVHLRDRHPGALQVVGSSSGCWADPWLENPWANFVTDEVRQQVAADICFFKAMSLMPALGRGPVTRWDLTRCMPGSKANEAMGMSRMVRMQLTGEAIHAICEHSVADLPWDLHEQVPSRFSLPGNGLLQVSGLRVVFDLTRSIGRRVICLTVDGDVVDRDRAYRVVTTGFLARGYSGYDWFRDGAEQEVIDSECSIVAASLGEGRTLPDVDGRLRFKDR